MEILTSNRKKVPTKSRWQDELKSAFRDVESLLDFVGLNRSDLPELQVVNDKFPIMVPKPFASRMERGDPNDPLLAQVLAFQTGLPLDHGADWQEDPVSDHSFQKVPGLLHKYHGRVLMLLTGACAIHCRYCFRQNFDYSSTQKGPEEAVDYIRANPTISEVILSGGDPLLKTDPFLADLFEQLGEIEHVNRIRIHTRTPVVIPSRITEEFLQVVSRTRPRTYMVLHINHSREIDNDVAKMVDRLRQHGILVLNQAVLLNGINSELESQRELCESLINLGVVPYYLHCLDRVNGAENYLVSESTGVNLIKELQKVLPGYGVPKLVREIAGNPSKDAIR